MVQAFKRVLEIVHLINPDQFATNVATKDGGERVEFAIRLPGQGTDRDETVWLPIDAKFPVEDYHRLIEAQEKSDVERVEAAGKQLETRVKACACDICEKYLNPPKTTDFGILFLPIEGLFAEVIRRTGLTEVIQRECRVVIAGPTTLWSILSSLQDGVPHAGHPEAFQRGLEPPRGGQDRVDQVWRYPGCGAEETAPGIGYD
jgi:DNA recombination protein RmuC